MKIYLNNISKYKLYSSTGIYFDHIYIPKKDISMDNPRLTTVNIPFIQGESNYIDVVFYGDILIVEYSSNILLNCMYKRNIQLYSSGYKVWLMPRSYVIGSKEPRYYWLVLLYDAYRRELYDFDDEE